MKALVLIQSLSAAGCGQIIAVDVADDKLRLSRKLGATAAVNSSNPDTIQQIQALTAGRGAVAPLWEGPKWFARLHQKEPGLLKVILKP